MLQYLQVSKPELALIKSIETLQHGEIYSLEIEAEEPGIPVRVSRQVMALINAIRDGLQHIDVLTVYAGNPTLAEVDLMLNGFHVRKKIRFQA